MLPVSRLNPNVMSDEFFKKTFCVDDNRLRLYSNHILFIISDDTYCIVKAYLFTLRKATFCVLICHLSCCKKASFVLLYAVR